jgi:uncharacterized cupin superfamily protein
MVSPTELLPATGSLMKKSLLVLLVLQAALVAPASAEDAPTVRALVKISASEVHSLVAFRDPATTRNKDHGIPYVDRVFGQSADRKMLAGIYESAATKTFYDSYPGDEFMFFIDGSVTLTDTSGKTVTVGPMEGVFMPRGWKGTWSSTAYRKYYVYYADSTGK